MPTLLKTMKKILFALSVLAFVVSALPQARGAQKGFAFEYPRQLVAHDRRVFDDCDGAGRRRDISSFHFGPPGSHGADLQPLSGHALLVGAAEVFEPPTLQKQGLCQSHFCFAPFANRSVWVSKFFTSGAAMPAKLSL